ncbi:lipoyl synthase, chloroplastic [Tanacetum coccineum]
MVSLDSDEEEHDDEEELQDSFDEKGEILLHSNGSRRASLRLMVECLTSDFRGNLEAVSMLSISGLPSRRASLRLMVECLTSNFRGNLEAVSMLAISGLPRYVSSYVFLSIQRLQQLAAASISVQQPAAATNSLQQPLACSSQQI